MYSFSLRQWIAYPSRGDLTTGTPKPKPMVMSKTHGAVDLPKGGNPPPKFPISPLPVRTASQPKPVPNITRPGPIQAPTLGRQHIAPPMRWPCEQQTRKRTLQQVPIAPPVAKNPRAGPHTSKSREEATMQSAIKAFRDHLANDLGHTSELWRNIEDSKHTDFILDKILRKTRPGSLRQICDKWSRWREWRRMTGIEVSSVNSSVVMDFLVDCQLESKEGRQAPRKAGVKPMLSALQYMARTSDCKQLLEILQSSSVKALAEPSSTGADKKEATPLSLASLAGMERWLLQADCPQHIVLIIGFCLCCTHSSLRFGDGQRCTPSSISLESGVLRGSCWRTKVSNSGQPFGNWARGLCGDWANKWQQAALTTAKDMEEPPDDLLPDISFPKGGPVAILNRPMAYTRFIGWIRWILQNLPDHPFRLLPHESLNVTSHSMKCTILSWAQQVGVPEDLRALQGHHRPSGQRKSVQTYSRDDVFGGLRCQQMVLRHIHSGWYPITPQGRGGRPPIAEKPVPKDWLCIPDQDAWKVIDATTMQAHTTPSSPPPKAKAMETMDHTEQNRDDESSGTFSDSASSSSTSSSTSPPPHPPNSTSGWFIHNASTGILHSAKEVRSDKDAKNQIRSEHGIFETMCRCELRKPCFQIIDAIPEMAMPCKRTTCAVDLKPLFDL